MSTGEIIVFTLFLASMLCGLIFIGLLFYIGKTRIKEIDKAILGYEFPHDSIFALIIRVPNYAGGFIWKWSAKRTGLTGKIKHFDTRFKWPFIAVMILVIMMFTLMFIGSALKNHWGIQ